MRSVSTRARSIVAQEGLPPLRKKGWRRGRQRRTGQVGTPNKTATSTEIYALQHQHVGHTALTFSSDPRKRAFVMYRRTASSDMKHLQLRWYTYLLVIAIVLTLIGTVRIETGAFNVARSRQLILTHTPIPRVLAASNRQDLFLPCTFELGNWPDFSRLALANIHPELRCQVLNPVQWPYLHGTTCADELRNWKRGVISLDTDKLVNITWLASVRWNSDLGMLTVGECSKVPTKSYVWPTCSLSYIADLDKPLRIEEQWRVKRYLGNIADIVSYCKPMMTNETRTPDASPICRAQPELLPHRSEPPVCLPDALLAHTRADVDECAENVPGVKFASRHYARDMGCALDQYMYSHAGLMAVGEMNSTPPLWFWSMGDCVNASRAFPPHFGKARLLEHPGRRALLPLNQERHSHDLRLVARMEPHWARPFARRAACLAWRGVTTGDGTLGFGWDNVNLNAEHSPLRRLLVESWGHVNATNNGIVLDIGYSKLVQSARIRPELHAKFVRPNLSLEQLASCRYQLSVEGNDVATGLKWQLYTDSVLIMPPPRVESWLLEGELLPFVHYVPVRRDFSDLSERLHWCETHAERAAMIAMAGRAHVMRILGQGGASDARVLNAIVRSYADAMHIRSTLTT